jgi:Ser-tRNA(Ala) deacylase AlaX
VGEPPAFERDPYLRELATRVVEFGEDGGGPWAVLADTVCFPAGGGQPCDHGRLGDTAIVDVQNAGGAIRHYLAGPVPAGGVVVRLDWARRYDHMQQHTGQHLLTAVAQDRFGWPTTAFHLGAETCDIELDVPGLDAARLDRLEEEANAEIRAARPVTARRVTQTEYAAATVRTRGLPAGHTGDVRLVEISGLDCNTCGGTHVRSTAEIGCLKVLGSEPMRGGTRVFFAAGGRVLRRLAAHERRGAMLRALLGAPDGELAAVAEAKLAELRRTEKALRAAEGELAEALAAALAAAAEAVVEAHWPGRELPFLQQVGRALAAAAPAKTALLTADGDSGACFVVAAGAAAGVDVLALGREVAAALGGRGGGSGRLAQGRAPSLAGRAEALRRLRAAAGG